ncbi:MAG: DUF3795 domain-containing protein [Candidatus Riflebacteria bacterium]|nr:DUF3795 domain-containing protein [Candidatus Riflebacteria bacterium]
MTNKEVIIARCGLVCSECGSYLKGKCSGCHSEKPMFANCPTKKCTLEKNILTCAECSDFQNLKECGKLHNWISRFFGWIYGTNRIGHLESIRKTNLESFKQSRTAKK